jgi:mycothiol synthase
MWMVKIRRKMSQKFGIRPFNVKAASPAEYAALNRHNNHIRLERLPDDPPVPLEEAIKNMQSLPPFVDVRMWVAWTPDQNEIAAQGNVVLLRMEDNKHLAQFDITVLAEYRLKGLGRELLSLIANDAQGDNRRLLMTQTMDKIPGGAAFMLRIGAQKGMEAHTNQLRIADLDSALLEKWLTLGRERVAEFELGLWDGPYPETELQAIAELTDLTNQQPHGDLDIEDMHMTPEQLRQVEQNLFARGSERWTFYVTDCATGKFVGYTETVWNPNRPEILRQDMTAVNPEYRGKGLGRWLKAAMLDKVLKDRPQVKFVRTGNADSNAAMLKINNELGFRPYLAEALWQVEVDCIQEYLKTK